jgi:signal transduction histidine kinase
MTFKKKLLLAFSVMTVPLAIICAQALWSVRQQRAALRRVELSLARARTFAEIESSTYRKVRKVRDYLSGQDPTARTEFERLDALSRSKLAEWKAAADDPADLLLMRGFEELDGQIVLLAGRLFSLLDEGRREQALRIVQEDLNGRLLPALDGEITAIYATLRTRSVRLALEEVEATARYTALVLVVIVAASAIFNGLFSIVIARNLARPVEQLKTTMDQVGEGSFDRAQAVDIDTKDEIGDLARAFVRMAERLESAQEDLRHKIDHLRQTQAQLVQSEKLASLGQMAAAVAHGLRNPLASIRAATQLSLHRLPSPSPLQEHLRAVIGEVDRLDKRIVHLLDFTKPVAFSPAPTSMRELVEGVIRVFGEKISQQSVQLRLDLDPSLPEAWVDASQLEQAIIEVVANALEAMPSGGSLLVAARSRPGGIDGSVLELAIKDTGDGIPADALPRVVEPFFTTKADGTGLGLAIAKRLVEQNKGEFAISSAEEKGTLVNIRLPAAPPVGRSVG